MHFFAAAAMRLHVPARAGFRAALRDFDFATAVRVGTPEFITLLNRHCVLLSAHPAAKARRDCEALMATACESQDIKAAQLAFIEKRKPPSSAASARQSPLSRRDPRTAPAFSLRNITLSAAAISYLPARIYEHL
ncbi:MAG TPA: hypothetical protein VF515_10070 [Candidatus Binatia bacterium]